ncbi:MAG: hypothetical protein JNK05_15005 [Myxococcales bacterium]|nr:hypothetical protein [Myxococcales bacterium]
MENAVAARGAYRAPTLSIPPSWELEAARRLAWWAITLRAISAGLQALAYDGLLPAAPTHTASAAAMLVVGVAAWRMQRSSSDATQRIASWIALAITGVFFACAASILARERFLVFVCGTPSALRIWLERGVPVTVMAAGVASLLGPLPLGLAASIRRAAPPADPAAVSDEDADRARASALRTFASSAYGIVFSMVGSITAALALEQSGATFMQTAGVRGVGLVAAALFVARALRASRTLHGWSPSVRAASGAFALWIAALASALVTIGVWLHVVIDLAGRSFVRGAWASQAVVECSTLLALVATANTAAQVAANDDRARLMRRSLRATLSVCALAGLLAWLHAEMPDFIMRTPVHRWAVYATMAFAVATIVSVARVASGAAQSLEKQSSRAAHVTR